MPPLHSRRACCRGGAPVRRALPARAAPDRLDATAAPPSSSARPPPHTPADAPPHATRRNLLFAGTAAAAAVATPPHARAVVAVPDPSTPTRSWTGRRRTPPSVEAYEFSVPLRVIALRGAAPAEWGADFRVALGTRGSLAFEARPQFESIWKELAAPDKGAGSRGVRGRVASAARADAVSLGDEWLAPAVRGGMLQPVPGAETARWWRSLPPRWHALLRRHPATGAPSSSGAVYGAPFRWGATLIGVRSSTLARTRGAAPITDWADLFQPALRGRIAFSDSARELLTVALGGLGLGPNPSSAALRSLPDRALAGAVALLRDQALLFSGRDHVRALAAGDALAAVGSSADIAPLALRSAAVDAVAPAGGTALWADVWAVPVFAGGGSSGPSPLLPAWMELPLTPSRAEPARGLRGGGASPLLLPAAGAARGARGAEVRASPFPLLLGPDAMPPLGVLQASEFLLPPADEDVAAEFRDALEQLG